MSSIKMTKEDLIKEILEIGLQSDHRGNIYGEKYSNYLKSPGLWQCPEELAGLLIFLLDLEIKTFLNIGTYNGMTFNFISDVLNRKNKVDCITIDPVNYNPVMDSRFSYQSKTSDDYKNQEFDFVFIDGDHSYDWVKRDYDNVGYLAKYVCFHDIEDYYVRNADFKGGVPNFWEDIKKTRNHIEFIESDKKDPKIMGIGLLI